MTIRQPTPFRSRARLTAEAEALPGSIADYLGDMVSAHAPDGTYRYVSAASKELLGYEPEELLGTSAYDHFHPEDVGRSVGVVHRSTLEGAPMTVAVPAAAQGPTSTSGSRRPPGCPEGRRDNDEVSEIVCSTRPLDDRRRPWRS